ncbi:hypothetical protein J2T57_003767 [Natronocella acetinitrilica]|uniref:SRPBCC domain-containing protein n=1 Tax=Natronocella acetinitrilica TaxID=414046 RepID=A0AAE3KDA2_9GAMM|nr:SRPBCC family protein [Natronocella acetinitrilica]MCP1676596.1 hypothetical protein [Natronocella acetinitrilica]
MRRELFADVTIAARPDEVWHVLVDLSSWPRWNPVVREVDGQLETGHMLSLTVEEGGRSRRLQAECMRVLPAQELSWLRRWHVPGLLDSEERLVLEEVEEGATRLLVRQRLSGILLPFLWRRLRPRLGRAGWQVAKAVKAAAEQ